MFSSRCLTLAAKKAVYSKVMPPLGSALVHPVHCQSGWKGPSAIASRGRRPHSSLVRCDGCAYFASLHQFLQCSKAPSGLKTASQYFPIILSSTQSYPNSTIAEVAHLQGNAALLLHSTGKFPVLGSSNCHAASAAPHIPVSLGSRGLKGP